MAKRRTTEWSALIEALYREQGRELWAAFYAQACDPDAAYDALQEAFLRLQDQNPDEILDPRAWLLQVGRNWLRDGVRRRKVAARPVPSLDHLADAADDPLIRMEHEEQQQQVRQALSQLKPDDREVLVLRYSLGWSSRRIADSLDSTAAAVDMRLSRARKRLGEILASMGIDHV